MTAFAADDKPAAPKTACADLSPGCRVHGGEQSRDDHRPADGASAHDGRASRQGGFRLDHYPTDGAHATWRSDVTTTDFAEHAPDLSLAGQNLLDRPHPEQAAASFVSAAEGTRGFCGKIA